MGTPLIHEGTHVLRAQTKFRRAPKFQRRNPENTPATKVEAPHHTSSPPPCI
ncbi:hypothetical protein Scep_021888 [Stephania cephalantha]|uniref:Uncharacterized protein n=1 Tax=Stephania cephalantha TaxID=152367 RepID=A0AAP0I275_9MAGN